MKQALVIGLLALVLFGVSAGVSWYLQHMKESAGRTKGEADGAASESQAPAKGGPPLRASVKSAPDPRADETLQLANRLRTQEEALKKREQALANRQKQIDLIFKDIRDERAAVDELRKQLQDEVRTAHELAESVEQKSTQLDQQRTEAERQMLELKRTMTDFETTELERVKQLAGIYDTMPADSAAKILETLANAGNMEIAVKILGTMKDRQAAKVLAEMRDPGLAAQLLEKLRGLRKPAPAPPKK
jgi:flagellar motility protein MotE (MotC chaperone)